MKGGIETGFVIQFPDSCSRRISQSSREEESI
jgi:hypothetical protein